MKHKKTVVMLLVAMMTCAMVFISVEAREIGSRVETPAMRTDKWTSCRDTDDVFVLTSEFSNPSSGDVGVSFFLTNEGLPESFVESTSRKSTFILVEKDGWKINDDEAVECTGSFGFTGAGLYTITTFVKTYPSPAKGLEDTSEMELYIKGIIDAVSGDLSYNVSAGLLKYEIWTD